MEFDCIKVPDHCLLYIFYPPTERFGGYSDEPGVRPLSVRPSVR